MDQLTLTESKILAYAKGQFSKTTTLNELAIEIKLSVNDLHRSLCQLERRKILILVKNESYRLTQIQFTKNRP